MKDCCFINPQRVSWCLYYRTKKALFYLSLPCLKVLHLQYMLLPPSLLAPINGMWMWFANEPFSFIQSFATRLLAFSIQLLLRDNECKLELLLYPGKATYLEHIFLICTTVYYLHFGVPLNTSPTNKRGVSSLCLFLFTILEVFAFFLFPPAHLLYKLFYLAKRSPSFCLSRKN